MWIAITIIAIGIIYSLMGVFIDLIGGIGGDDEKET